MRTETDRLRIRDFVRDDWQAVHAFLSDPEVTRHTSFYKANEEDTRRYVDECIFHNNKVPRFAHNCAILLKTTGEVVGWIGFGHPSENGIGDRDFGYALRQDQWNRGYMTEALMAMLRFCLAELRVGSVFGECHPENPASARVMEKAGLTFVGIYPSRSEEGALHQRFIAYQRAWLTSHS